VESEKCVEKCALHEKCVEKCALHKKCVGSEKCVEQGALHKKCVEKCALHKKCVSTVPKGENDLCTPFYHQGTDRQGLIHLASFLHSPEREREKYARLAAFLEFPERDCKKLSDLADFLESPDRECNKIKDCSALLSSPLWGRGKVNSLIDYLGIPNGERSRLATLAIFLDGAQSPGGIDTLSKAPKEGDTVLRRGIGIPKWDFRFLLEQLSRCSSMNGDPRKKIVLYDPRHELPSSLAFSVTSKFTVYRGNIDLLPQDATQTVIHVTTDPSSVIKLMGVSRDVKVAAYGTLASYRGLNPSSTISIYDHMSTRVGLNSWSVFGFPLENVTLLGLTPSYFLGPAPLT
jgi:hypothetical protein